MTLNLHEATAVDVPAAAHARSGLPRVLNCLALNPGRKFGSMEEQLVLLARRFEAEGGEFLPLFIANAGEDVSQFRERGVDACCLELDRFSW